jgi:uncharacterized membrane protein YeaQ/YmgE (transglycosylase-associated protein family)
MKIKREVWQTLMLVGAGWFVHDAIWHFLMVAYGMSGIVTIEFSLPDLEALGIRPDRGIQTMAFVIAVVFAVLLLIIARRLRVKVER